MRPIVAVTGPSRGGTAAWMMTRAAVARAGGKPERLTPSRGFGPRSIDALVLGGGADLDPALYEETDALANEQNARRVDIERDAFEIDLLDRAFSSGIPILGICRGSQLINIRRGGTLYGDIGDLYAEAAHVRSLLPKKRVSIEPESRLREILGVDACWVNALHHQAIRALGAGLRVVARDGASVVQAIELVGSSFCLGVQWHPEYLPQHSRQRALFTALVAAVSKRHVVAHPAR